MQSIYSITDDYGYAEHKEAIKAKGLKQVHFAEQRVRNATHLWSCSKSDSFVLLFNKTSKTSQYRNGQKIKPVLGNGEEDD